jgi:Xaa-Pro aminopeptidase
MNVTTRIAAVGALLAAVLALGASAQKKPAPVADGLASDELFTNPTKAVHRFDEFVYTPNERLREATEKVERLRKTLAARKLDGVVIGTERNLNWLTAGGKDTVVWAQRETGVKLLVTADKLYLIANNIEGPRVSTEELAGLGYEWVQYNWYGKEKDALEPLLKGKKVAFDLPADAVTYKRDPVKMVFDFQEVYYPITQGELKKYRWLGHKTVEVLEQVAQVVRPGMTERDVQYLLNREYWYWDIFPTVVLSAVDDRFRTYRHPVVMGATLKNYVALNVCTRRWGLVISTTRLVYFGQPDAALAKAWAEGPKVDAAMLAASRPGNTLGDVVKAAQKAYSEIGYPDEWKLHHQGGMVLGLERLYLVPPGDKTEIRPGMVLAWNPTVQGSKFEDTVVVKENGSIENLTPTLKWPTVDVSVGTTNYKIPGLLIRDMPPSGS